MRLAILLFCGVFLLGQSTPPTPAPNPESPAETADGKSQNQKLDLRASSQGCGSLDVLSDTQGVDFGPYLQSVVSRVRENWYRLIPDSVKSKKGKLAIEFAIRKDGQVADMRLVAKSGDIALDRPAWGSITASNPFPPLPFTGPPPLPSEFTGPFLALRFPFCYNPDLDGPDSSGEGGSGVPKISSGASNAKTKSGIAVSITKPVPGQTDVPLGGSTSVMAIVTGTGTKEKTVEWSITGLGCSGTLCGELIKDSYHAPRVMPTSPFVVLTGVARADPTAKASITLHIVQPSQ